MERKYKFFKKEYDKESLVEEVLAKINFEIKQLENVKKRIIKFKDEYKGTLNTKDAIIEMVNERYDRKIADERYFANKRLNILKEKISQNDVADILNLIALDIESQESLFGYFTEQYYEASNFKLDRRMVEKAAENDVIIIDCNLDRFAVEKKFVEDFAKIDESEISM